MVYSFARIGVAVGMKVEDIFTQNRRLWVRLHEMWRLSCRSEKSEER
jgi:hypothetical protein